MPDTFVFQSPKNPNSHLTVKDRRSPSFPLKHLLSRDLIIGDVLDFGCGLGTDVTYLKQCGLNAYGYDPYYSSDIPKNKFDTILCTYVLNVLLPDEQAHVLMAISELLKPDGKAYFTVRRDIQRTGFRIHIKHGVEVYQCNVVLPYKSLLLSNHCEIYEYQHINHLRKNVSSNCPFCFPEGERDILTESATVYAMFDKYPVSPGHTLVVPKQHIADYFDLNERTKTASWMVVDRVKMLLNQRFKPDGYNIGFNVGRSAGQTVPHVHIHVIPRYEGDIENPVGGVRAVISGKADYLNRPLK